MKYGTSFLFDRLYLKQPRLRRFVTRLLEGDSNRKVEVAGTTLAVNTIKEHGYLRASRLGRSSSVFRDEIAVLINLAFLLNDRDTFVDVGANVGLYAHTIARFSKIAGRLAVYAFEANPDTFSRLADGNRDGVHLQQLAISHQEAELEFVAGAVSHVFTTKSHASAYNLTDQVVRVRARRLDKCDIKGDSLVIKVDVEGQELEVLQGASGFLEAGRVKAVYLDGYKDRGVKHLLHGYGFAFFDGRTLESTDGNVFSLLAIHPSKHPGIKRP